MRIFLLSPRIRLLTARTLSHSHPPSYYSHLYRENGLKGGHLIKLGPGNDEAAKSALQAWPNALQLGGGITDQNALEWLDAGAEKVGPPLCTFRRIGDSCRCQVIVTSFLFPNAKFDKERLRKLSEKVEKARLVVDVR